jgi:hypothetical protein
MKINVPDHLKTMYAYVISMCLNESIAIGSSLRVANIARSYVGVEIYEDMNNLLTSLELPQEGIYNEEAVVHEV